MLSYQSHSKRWTEWWEDKIKTYEGGWDFKTDETSECCMIVWDFWKWITCFCEHGVMCGWWFVDLC